MASMTPPLANRNLVWTGLALAVLGGAATALGARVAAERMAFSFLWAFSSAVATAVGALLFLMLGYAINATWMSAVRRLCEAVSMALVPLAALFAVLVMFSQHLYVWLHPEDATDERLRHVLEHNRLYLNLSGFIARGVVCFAIWLVPALLLRRWSTTRAKLDTDDPIEALHRERGLSAAMLLPGVLAMTFAAFDWMMSLEPDWFSGAYGLYYLNGGAVSAVALVMMLGHFAIRSGMLRDVLTPNHFHALGRVLFAFVILWAYIAYFQVFLIFIADKPAEVAFYVARGHGSWHYFGPALGIGHFAIPILLLAPKAWKMRTGFMAAVCAWLALMHLADIYYLTMPVQSPETILPSWCDAAALSLVFGLCIAFCSWLQLGLPLVAENDPLLPQGLRYRSEQ